ncbi:MAG: sigma-E factor negative regulatory protein [Anaerolineae bacterium]|nr:sigma-E factor negative regulatory protein [Anaerolineae bacterium]
MVNELNTQHSMNNALDHELSAAELDALNTQLEASPEATEYWRRLRRIDQLLRNAPLIRPLPGFSDRVMVAIASMPLSAFANKQFGLGAALGLVAAAVLTVPLLSVAAILLVNAIIDPGTMNGLLQVVTAGTSYVIDVVSDLGSGLHTLVTETPMVPALISTVIPVSMLWVWMIWYFSGSPRLFTRQ